MDYHVYISFSLLQDVLLQSDICTMDDGVSKYVDSTGVGLTDDDVLYVCVA